jgi:hypothetical protein
VPETGRKYTQKSQKTVTVITLIYPPIRANIHTTKGKTNLQDFQKTEETIMENKIEKAYNEFEELNKRFGMAIVDGNTEEEAKIRKEYDAWREKYATTKSFRRIFHCHAESRERGNALLNMGDEIEDREEFLKNLKENGVTKFTCTIQNVLFYKTIEEFRKAGYKCTGGERVKGEKYPYPSEIERETLCGIIFESI